jgi:hypothetical protein
MTISISPYTVIHNLLDAVLRQPEPVFDENFVMGAACMSSYGDQRQDARAQETALSLLTWTPEDRTAFLEKYEVPSRVLGYLASPPTEWPSIPILPDPAGAPPLIPLMSPPAGDE